MAKAVAVVTGASQCIGFSTAVRDDGLDAPDGRGRGQVDLMIEVGGLDGLSPLRLAVAIPFWTATRDSREEIAGCVALCLPCYTQAGVSDRTCI